MLLQPDAAALYRLRDTEAGTLQRRHDAVALDPVLDACNARLAAGKRPGYSLTGLNIAMHAFESILALHRAAPSR